MSKSKSRKKRPPKRVLALPDLEHAKTAVLNSLTSASGQRTYDHAIPVRRVVIRCRLIGRPRRARSPVTDEYDALRGAQRAGLNPAMEARAPLHADGYCTCGPSGARWTISMRVPQGSVM